MIHKNNIFFTIIIPSYNSSKHIIKCLKSVTNLQSKDLYEVVIVDDFSTDKSYNLNKTFIKNHQKISCIRLKKNYGPGNISVGTDLKSDADVKLSLTGLWFRINDKIQRLKQLIVLGEPDSVGESVEDTFQDLSVYGIIAQIVQQKKFK